MERFIDKVYDSYYENEINGVYSFLKRHGIEFKTQTFNFNSDAELCKFCKQNYCFDSFKKFQAIKIIFLS
jgi:hypothetical protein